LTFQPKHAIAFDLRKKMIYHSPDGSTDQRFCLSPNYFGLCHL